MPRIIKRMENNVSRIFYAIYGFFISAVDLVFGRIQRLIGIRGMPYLFVLPNLLIFGIFIIFPMLLNFLYAFTGGTEFFLNQRSWVGFSNFEQLFTCQNFLVPNSCAEDRFWRAVYNTLGYVGFQVILMVVISVITALVLNRRIKARGFFRSIYFYPTLLSPIVVALIWKWILDDNGLLNGIISIIGYDRIPFLLDVQWARFWVIMISVWAYMGFYTLILLAGLQSIPSEYYEAASMDGANIWQSFRNITLPLLMPTLSVVLILSIIRAVQVYEIIFAFTGGGPGTATQYLVQYIFYYGFMSPDKRFGLAAAVSLLMAFVLIILTLAQLYIRRKEE